MMFDFRGNESLHFYELERITDIRSFDKNTMILDTMYTTKKGTFSRTALVDITPTNIQDIKRQLFENQTSIYEVMRLSEELFNIIKEGDIKK